MGKNKKNNSGSIGLRRCFFVRSIVIIYFSNITIYLNTHRNIRHDSPCYFENAILKAVKINMVE